MEIDLKESFDILDNGSRYSVPMYEVVDGKGLVLVEGMTHPINFVRGSKLGSDDVEKKTGTLHEHLMSVMIHDLTLKNELVPSEETTQVILKLKEALNWQRARSIDRVTRAVQETYKK